MGTFERHIVVGFVHLTGFRLYVVFLKLIHLELKSGQGSVLAHTRSQQHFYPYMYDVLSLELRPFLNNTTVRVTIDRLLSAKKPHWFRTYLLFITFTFIELARYIIIFQYIFDFQLICSLLFIQFIAASVRGPAQSALCKT